MLKEIEQIKNFSFLDLRDHADLFQLVCQHAEKSPQTAELLLPDFYRLLEGEGLSFDLIPFAAETFASITKGLSKAQINEAVDKLYMLNKQKLFNHCDIICERNPNCADILFNHLANDLKQQNYNEQRKRIFTRTVQNMLFSLFKAPDSELPTLFKQIDSFSPEIQDLFAYKFGDLYAKKPVLREALWEKITKSPLQKSTDFDKFYQNLKSVFNSDATKTDDCLRIIDDIICNPEQTDASLKTAYEVLGEIRKNHPNKAIIDNIFIHGLQNPKNTESSIKIAYRQMERFDKLTSCSTIGQRIEKTTENPFGFTHADTIATDVPAILVLGGNATISDKSANGYLSSIEELFHSHNLKENISLYAAIYDFGNQFYDSEIVFDGDLARAKLMQDHHRSIKVQESLNEDTLHPKYVEDLFQKAFLQRICNEKGEKLPVDEACAKMRNLTVMAHCHGAYTFLKLEEKMQQKMAELGYSSEDRQKIQKQLLCVALAPAAPLGVSKSTMISFASAKDSEVEHYNNFQKEVQNLSEKDAVLFSYFPEKQGELFLTPAISRTTTSGKNNEHNFLGFNSCQENLIKEGQMLLRLSGNALVNGVKNASERKPLPSVKELVCGEDKSLEALFDTLEKNGQKMWRTINQNTALRLRMLHSKIR